MPFPVRSKKMAAFLRLPVQAIAGHIQAENGPIGPMTSEIFTLNRRSFWPDWAAVTLTPACASAGSRPPTLALQAKRSGLSARPRRYTVWSLAGPDLRFKRGEIVDVSFA